MDADGDGELTRLEFLEFFIIKLKLCTEQQLSKIQIRFDQIEQERRAREIVASKIDQIQDLTNSGVEMSTLASQGWGKSMVAVEKLTGHQVVRPTVMPRHIAGIDRPHADTIVGGGRDISLTTKVMPLSINTEEEEEEEKEKDKKLHQVQQKTRKKEKNNDKENRKTPSPTTRSSTSTTPSPISVMSQRTTKERNSLSDSFERTHPLSSMLAHIRRASELARNDVENSIKNGKTEEAKASVRMLRQLITLLHDSQKSFLPRLQNDDPERSMFSLV